MSSAMITTVKLVSKSIILVVSLNAVVRKTEKLKAK